MVDAYLAEIRLFAGTYAPRNWAFCAGQTLNISEYDALYSIIGTTYGGDGQTNFKLPDMRSRVAVGMGQSPGTSNWPLASMAGVQTVTLTQSNLPPHTHTTTTQVSEPTVTVSNGMASIPVSADATSVLNEVDGGYLAMGGAVPSIYTPQLTNASELQPVPVSGVTESQPVAGGTVTVGLTGSSYPMEVYQPILGMNYIICLQGLYPSKN